MAVYKIYLIANIRAKPIFVPKNWTEANINELVCENEPNGHFSLIVYIFDKLEFISWIDNSELICIYL